MSVADTTVPPDAPSDLPGELRRAIANGEYPPGTKLVERELTLRYGLGRTAVRDALRHLSGERIVVLTENRGARVRELNYTEAAEIYQVRSVLEGLAGELFAARGTAQQKLEFAESFTPVRQAHLDQDTTQILVTSEAFFGHILRGAGNVELQQSLYRLHVRINQIRRFSVEMPEHSRAVVESLQAIVDAILGNDPADARAACIAHVRASAAATLPRLALHDQR